MTKDEIIRECNLAFQKRFLELTGHKEGDKVDVLFLSWYGTAKESSNTYMRGTGTIVLTDDGYRIRSDNEYPQLCRKRKYPGSVCRFETYNTYEPKTVYADITEMIDYEKTADDKEIDGK